MTKAHLLAKEGALFSCQCTKSYAFPNQLLAKQYTHLQIREFDTVL